MSSCTWQINDRCFSSPISFLQLSMRMSIPVIGARLHCRENGMTDVCFSHDSSMNDCRCRCHVFGKFLDLWYAKKFLELWYKKNFVSLSCLSSNRFSSFGILGAMVWEALSNPLLDTELYRLGRWRLHTWNTGDKQWRQGSQTMTITSWCDGVYFLVWVQASFVEDGDDDNELV
jgi:hypothetical protein